MLASFCLAPTAAYADVYCGYVPGTAHVTNVGDVLLRDNYNRILQLCNLKTAWKGVEPSTCFAWFSTVNTAVNEHRGLGVYYAGSVQCATLPEYSNSPAPIYVMLIG